MSSLDIAQALRLKRSGCGWRGDCPACGYRGTFSLATKNGRDLWWCASCQDKEAVTAAVRNAVGADWISPSTRAPTAPDNASRTRAALAIWEEAIPIEGTIAETYLSARGLSGEASTALRYHPALHHPNETASFPCLVALVVSTATDKPVGIHRTFLRRDGAGKAAVEPAKASKGPIGGGAIMLHAPRPGAPLVIGEGIETSLSAARLMGACAWAAVTAGNFSRITPPASPSEIIIAADPDPTGQTEAWAGAWLWRAEGRRVRIATPDAPGKDFNDLWRARMAREVAHG